LGLPSTGSKLKKKKKQANNFRMTIVKLETKCGILLGINLGGLPVKPALMVECSQTEISCTLTAISVYGN
jgi:hypothetical protein